MALIKGHPNLSQHVDKGILKEGGLRERESQKEQSKGAEQRKHRKMSTSKAG